MRRPRDPSTSEPGDHSASALIVTAGAHVSVWWPVIASLVSLIVGAGTILIAYGDERAIIRKIEPALDRLIALERTVAVNSMRLDHCCPPTRRTASADIMVAP